MVLPDGTGSNNQRPRKARAGIFIVAALAIVVGFAALGSLTSPDTAAIEQTTTTTEPPDTTSTTVDQFVDPDTFAVDQIAQGKPLEWEQSIVLDDGYPIALVSHDDWTYLFSSETPNFSGHDEGGLRAWRSTDGVAWEPLGQVIAEPHLISTVSSTGQGLVALEPGEVGDGFTVWRSDDGVEWAREQITVDGPDDLAAVQPQTVAGTRDLLVVSSDFGSQVYTMLRDRIAETLGVDSESATFGWGTEVSEGELRVTIYGPLGIRLDVLSAEEVGLTDQEREALLAAETTVPRDAQVWAVDGDSSWRRADVPDASWIQSITTTAEGDVLIVGSRDTGTSLWVSSDGTTWEELPTTVRPHTAQRWGDRLIGPGTGAPSVLVSPDGRNWNDIGPPRLFPFPISWNTGPIGAGPGGVAVAIHGSAPANRATDLQPEPTVRGEGGTLTLDLASARITVHTDDGESHNWRMNSTAPDGIQTNFATGRLVFNHPDTGERLASFDIDDVYEAENEYWSSQGFGDEFAALAFTPDGSEWTIQDLGVIAADNEISFLDVTETHVVAVGISTAGLYDSTLSPGLQVWSAAIP